MEYEDNYVSLAEFRNEHEAVTWIREDPEYSEEFDQGKLVITEYNDESAELNALIDLLEDFSPGSDASFAVNEDYLENYAQEEAESLDGITDKSFFWQFIDWEEAAQALTQDMQSTEFRGSNYWIVMR